MNKDRQLSKQYEDMLDMPHHVSEVHPQMDPLQRAAQFAPFAALSGYEEAVKETARQFQASQASPSDYSDSSGPSASFPPVP